MIFLLFVKKTKKSLKKENNNYVFVANK